MKYDENIEQLLNGFIDGQLTPREQTELKRLMRNDAQLEKRLAQLQKCRMLLVSLPVEKAPDGLIERVGIAETTRTAFGGPRRVSTDIPSYRQESVEPASLHQESIGPRRAGLSETGESRRASQGEPAPAESVRTGARQLMLRKMLSAAAIILLTAGLLVIVWMVVSPGEQIPKPPVVVKKPVETPVAETKGTTEKPVSEPALTNTKVTEAASAAGDVKASVVAAPPGMANATKQPEPEKAVSAVTIFSATVQLKAEKLLAADVALKNILEQTLASEFVRLPTESAKGSLTGGDKYVYALDCNVAKMNSFLAAAEAIWEQFSDAKLLVRTGPERQSVVIDSVKTWQIGDLSAISDPERLIKAAQYYAILNDSQRILQQDDQALAQGEEDILQLLDKPKPKPVLTKDEQPGEKRPTGQQKVHLTIELSADQK